MPKINNVEFLTLPQQVSKNKKEVVKLDARVTKVETLLATTGSAEVLDLKDKFELLANLAYPMPNLVTNSALTLDSNSDGIPDGFTYSLSTTAKTLSGGVAKFVATASYARLEQAITLNANDLIYYYSSVKSDSNKTYLVGVANQASSNAFHSGSNEFELLSNIQVASGSFNLIQVGDSRTTGFTPISVDYIGAYNASTMKLKGIKNDAGMPFNLLTNTQIKTQLDLWVQTRFPLDVLLMIRS